MFLINRIARRNQQMAATIESERAERNSSPRRSGAKSASPSKCKVIANAFTIATERRHQVHKVVSRLPEHYTLGANVISGTHVRAIRVTWRRMYGGWRHHA